MYPKTKPGQNELIQTIRDSLMNLLQKAGRFESINITAPDKSNGISLKSKYSPDLIFNVRTKDNLAYTLFMEAKVVGQPQYIRSAINQLQSVIVDTTYSYGIIAAPFLSDETISICEQNNIGCIDIAGNCFLKFDGFYAKIQGNPNLFSSTRSLKSIFAAKSSRLLRILMAYPKKDWSIQELARESKISLGLTSNLKSKLLEYEFITKEFPRKFRLQKPEALLKKWSENYTYKKNRLYSFYSFDQPKDIEAKIASYCGQNNISYAFTLTSGSALISPTLRYNKVFAYINDDIKKTAQDMEWKTVETGANITILEPYDEGVFLGLRKIGDASVVSDIQLFLDLQSYKSRGDEAAEVILERIKAQW